MGERFVIQLDVPVLDRLLGLWTAEVERKSSERVTEEEWKTLRTVEREKIQTVLSTFDRMSDSSRRICLALIALEPSERPSSTTESTSYTREDFANTAAEIISHPIATQLSSYFQQYLHEVQKRKEKD